MGKRIILSAMLMLIFTVMLSLCVSAATVGATSDGLKYSISDEKATIIGFCGEESGSLVIPDEIDGCPVTIIGNKAFYECSGFTGSLTIGKNVERIGDSAFEGCSGFTGSLTIPDSVTIISYGAFDGCSGFDGNLTISANVTNIRSCAFSGCSGLTGNLIIPEKVTSIEDFAFYGCSGLGESLTIGENVTEIGFSSFEGCGKITEVHFKGNAPSVYVASDYTPSFDSSVMLYYLCYKTGWTDSSDYDADAGTWNGYKLMSLIDCGKCGYTLYWQLDAEGTLIIHGSGALADYKSVYDSTLERNVTTAPWGKYDSALQSLVLEDGVTCIGSYAFYRCSSLSGSLTIPDSVTKISEFAFSTCSGFTGSLTIPDKVTTIGDGAFNYCTNLTGSLIIPDSVTYIGNSAFSSCYSFNGSLIIGENVTTIGEYAFFDCHGFKGNLTIPDNVTRIDRYAFSLCEGLSSVYLVGDVPTVCGENALNIYTSAWKIYYNAANSTWIEELDGGNKWKSSGGKEYTVYPMYIGKCGDTLCWKIIDGTLTIYGSGDMYNYDYMPDFSEYEHVTTAPWGIYYESIKELVIEDGVNGIGSCAFYGCTNITGNLTIPASVTNIGDYAFYWCCGLTGNLTIPDGITSIGNYVFYWCSGFNGNLTIPDSVTSIGNYAFLNCNGLTGRVTIPDGVTSIGKDAFYGCSSLGCIYFAGDVPTCGQEAFDTGNSAFTICYNPSNESWTEELEDGNTWNAFGEDSYTVVSVLLFNVDVNGDGKLNVTDAVCLLWAINGKENYSIPSGADCDYNGDGIVNVQDAVYLLWHIFYPDEYPIA